MKKWIIRPIIVYIILAGISWAIGNYISSTFYCGFISGTFYMAFATISDRLMKIK